MDETHERLFTSRQNCFEMVLEHAERVLTERSRDDQFHQARLTKREDYLRTMLRDYALLDMVLVRHTGIYDHVYGSKR